jgi:hypothetical protein
LRTCLTLDQNDYHRFQSPRFHRLKNIWLIAIGGRRRKIWTAYHIRTTYSEVNRHGGCSAVEGVVLAIYRFVPEILESVEAVLSLVQFSTTVRRSQRSVVDCLVDIFTDIPRWQVQ